MEKEYLSYDELEKILDTDLINVNGYDFWKCILLEQILQEEKEYKVTKNDLDNMAKNLVNNDEMWQFIDNFINEELMNYRK